MALLSNFVFGIQTTLYVLTLLAVLLSRTSNHNRLLIDLLVYVFVLFEVTTVGSQMAFITQRNYPGGLSAFLSDQYSTLVNLAATILVVCANWTMESLLVRPPPLSVSFEKMTLTRVIILSPRRPPPTPCPPHLPS